MIKAKKQNEYYKKLITILFIIICTMFLSNCSPDEEDSIDEPDSEIVATDVETEIEPLATSNINTADRFENLSKSIARIETESGMIGTGFLVSKTKLLTAAHVVFGNSIVKVVFTKTEPMKEFTAKILYMGKVQEENGLSIFLEDFALLEIPEVDDLEPLKMGNSEQVKELDEVLTIGHSQGDPSLSFTDGKINSKKYGIDNLDLFKHSIQSNPGNSGGPIILKSNLAVIGILLGTRSLGLNGASINIPQGENIANKINNIKFELKNNNFEI